MGAWKKLLAWKLGEESRCSAVERADRTTRAMTSFRGLTWHRLAPATVPCFAHLHPEQPHAQAECVQSHGPAHRAGTTLVAAARLAAYSCERRRSGRVCSGAVLTHADACGHTSQTGRKTLYNCARRCPRAEAGPRRRQVIPRILLDPGIHTPDTVHPSASAFGVLATPTGFDNSWCAGCTGGGCLTHQSSTQPGWAGWEVTE